MSPDSIFICRVIASCNTLLQLAGAERLMINAGKDLTEVVEAKRLQLLAKCEKRAAVNKAINDAFNALANV